MPARIPDDVWLTAFARAGTGDRQGVDDLAEELRVSRIAAMRRLVYEARRHPEPRRESTLAIAASSSVLMTL
jgi:hypothetical protein